MQLRKPATAILALALSAGLAQADDAAPAAGNTLDKIAKNGVIVVGHRESSVPFSYYDNQQKVVGYSQDYSNAIVEAVKKKLNKPDLQVKLIPITSQNRIPLLQNGTFDFECGSTTNNAERQKQAAFSDTIFVVGTRLLTKKGGDIKDFADLKGKAVVVTSGTTSEVLLNKLNEEQKMNMRIISAKDHGDSFRTLESGRAVAFMMDDALLAGERAKAKKPDNWEIVGKPQSQEAYGCMLRKDDPQFKKLMDAGEVGGTALVGISKPVIKAHGSSDDFAIKNAIRQAAAFASAGIIEDITENIGHMRLPVGGMEKI